ncbi:MAG: hypothetical protein GY822_18790 [Deltaproteobacteria bacterium]|nr:hypothetical protein [Deltaproteobacteria bacterium]
MFDTTPASMREYFREALQSAAREKQLSVSETCEVYIVHLLSEFGRAEKAFAGTENGEGTVLVDLLGRAQEAPPEEAMRIYKHMGDSSLYLSGFFSDSVQNRSVSPGYYKSMGESAYAQVAGLMRTSAATSSALFCELAERFGDLVNLLSAMSLHGEKTAPKDAFSDVKILELVERYRKTGSEEVLQALKRHGVVLRPGLSEETKPVQKDWVH